MPRNKPSSRKPMDGKGGAQKQVGQERPLGLVSQPSSDASSGAASALATTRPRQWRILEAGKRPKVVDKFARAMHDYQQSASLFDQGPSVALIDACIDDLLVRAGELEDREFRAKSIRMSVSVRARMEEKDYGGVHDALANLIDYLEQGAEYDRCMARAVDYAERRNKLSKDARELACREAQTLTYRQAQELCANMFAVVREVCGEDIGQANLIIASVTRLMTAELGMSVHGGATREEAAEVVSQVRAEEAAIDV